MAERNVARGGLALYLRRLRRTLGIRWHGCRSAALSGSGCVRPRGRWRPSIAPRGRWSRTTAGRSARRQERRRTQTCCLEERRVEQRLAGAQPCIEAVLVATQHCAERHEGAQVFLRRRDEGSAGLPKLLHELCGLRLRASRWWLAPENKQVSKLESAVDSGSSHRCSKTRLERIGVRVADGSETIVLFVIAFAPKDERYSRVKRGLLLIRVALNSYVDIIRRFEMTGVNGRNIAEEIAKKRVFGLMVKKMADTCSSRLLAEFCFKAVLLRLSGQRRWLS